MTTLTACIIVKNEEQFLEESLNSIKKLVDEIIVVDTGSTDKTREIARKFTDKIFHFDWINDFSAARNFSLTKATGDWILIIDGDEIIAKKDHDIIKKIIRDEKFPLVSVVQRNYTDKKSPLFKEVDERYRIYAKELPGYVPSEIIRLFKNNINIQFEGAVHETVAPSMRKQGLKFLRTDIPIHHYQHLKPKIEHKEKLDSYIALLQKKEEENPKEIKTLHDLAIVYLEQKKDYKKAFEYFKKIYDADNNLLEPYLGMGVIYGKARQYEKATRILTKGLSNKTTKTIEMRTDHEKIRQTILFNLAQILEKTGDKEKAKESYKLLLETSFPMKEIIKRRLEALK